MEQRGTLLSAFRREKARQFQKCQKHLFGVIIAAFVTTFVVSYLNRIFLPELKTSVKNFSNARECLTPDKNSSTIKVGSQCIYIHSVLASFEEPSSSALNVVINAWDGTGGSSDFLCCLLVKSNVITVLPYTLNSFSMQSPFHAVQYNCPVAGGTLKPTHISFSDDSCTRRDLNFRPITYTAKSVDELGVCAKVAEGRLIPERLVEWFEIQKILGVEKVVIHTHNLHEDSMQVLKYYEGSGLLEIIPYSLPQKIIDKPNRGFGYENRHYSQFYNDLQLVLYDCKERLRGYRYVTTTGFDEFIIPNGEISNLYDLLEHQLRREHKHAATFSFPVKTFITDWNKADPDNELFHLQYFMRQPLNHSQCGSIHLPNRIKSMTAHGAMLHYQYQKIQLSEDIASFHRYIPCPPNMDNCLESTRYHDNSLFFYRKMLKAKMEAIPSYLRQEF